jgi:hypothetical protein
MLISIEERAIAMQCIVLYVAKGDVFFLGIVSQEKVFGTTTN